MGKERRRKSSSESGCGGWCPGPGAEGLLEAATGLNTAQLPNRGVTSCSARGCFHEISLTFAIRGIAEKFCALEVAPFACVLARG